MAETHNLPAPSHLLRSPAPHFHSNSLTDGITPACGAEQSTPVHFSDAVSGHDDTCYVISVGLSG